MTEQGHSHKSCIKLFEKLSEYIDGELDDASCEQIRRHVESCLECDNCLKTLKKTITICKSLRQNCMPASFSQKIDKMLQRLCA
ncbi:MAG: zf-HC2 domain-containing protein [Desulfobacterales bacterium]|nr:zf-HC2 domain-containing protein [Desulfobacterales bacterium]